MKILIINSSDSEGGAARAAYRLHKALLVSGFESRMLVQSRISDDFTVIGPQTKFKKIFNRFRPMLDSIMGRFYKNRKKTLFSSSWLPFSSIVDYINSFNPDVVHLHWIADGLIRIEDLSKINYPIVWSLHDDWGYTGGCHIKLSCERYKQSCGACPHLGSKKTFDLSRNNFNRKAKTYSKLSNIKIIGLSRWLTDCAIQSTLFKGFQVINLPNLLNTEIFAPFDKWQSRDLFNLPKDKKLLMFGAMNATSDINKGFKMLSDALLQLDSNQIELVVFGSSYPMDPPNFKQNAHYLGLLHDDVSLRLLYSAADVMIVPSLQENLSNAIMESLSCGTPVVCFDIGGNSDLIDHKWNGYLAKPYDIFDLAEGIKWVINQPDYMGLCKNARQKVIREFDSHVVVKKYIDLYKEVSRT